MPKLLFLSGSTRKDSLNIKLANLAAKMAKDAGADVTLIDLKDFDMPIYNGDLESENGLPESAKKLKKLFAEYDGFFIASPEYNSSFSPLLKNSLDWISRKENDEEEALIAYKGKVAAIGAASPSWRGGLRGLVPLRMMLSNIGVFVTPTQTIISAAHKAFNDDGTLKDPMHTTMLKDTIDEFILTAEKLKG